MGNAMFEHVRARLQQAGQGHVLRFYEELPAADREALLRQIDALDLAPLPTLIERFVLHPKTPGLPQDLAPARYFPASPSRGEWDPAGMRRRGTELIRQGKVAAFVVAGGQGSRLGFEGPKGCYPAGAVTRRSLFAFFADGLLYWKDRLGVDIPWYIMTSPLNHDATMDYFERNAFFGLSRQNVRFFPQGVMPSLDLATGKVLLADKHAVATNPDGHGGAVRALHASGSLEDMRSRGVEHVSYFQVDNPLVRCVDPAFLALHADSPGSSGEMSSKMVLKAYAQEKMGIFCEGGGKVQVLEYSDMPAELQGATLPDGSLKFAAGSIAIHAISREFLHRLATDADFSLPYHRAEKKIPCVDLTTGHQISPDKNNGVKLERFIFDAIPLCRRSMVMETLRAEEFAPIKNATGVDSAESCRDLQTARAAAWLERAGVAIPRRPDGSPDCTLELSPRTAQWPEDLQGRTLPKAVERGSSMAL